MGVLCWERPKRIMSKKDWASQSADGAPPGVYSPNMSDADMRRWKAKLVGKSTDHPVVEIRVGRGALLLVKVSLKGKIPNGHPKSAYMDERHPGYQFDRCNVRITANGPVQLSLADWEDMRKAVAEAVAALKQLREKEDE